MSTQDEVSPLPTLPALKGLGTLADVRPTIIVDSREQCPLRFTRLPSRGGTLTSGDYSALGCEHLLAIERKSTADLVGCCMGENRERFERELHRLRGFRFKRLLVMGSEAEIRAGQYRSRINPASVLNSLAAWETRFNVPVVWAADPATAARLIEGWVWWFSRELVSQANELLRAAKAQRRDNAAQATALTELNPDLAPALLSP
jgi:DNA excision repair protein ERCC-4